LSKVKGVKKSNWNVESKMLTVTFDESKITLKQIKQKIADAGHDTNIV
jgi:copper chaperone CopZ